MSPHLTLAQYAGQYLDSTDFTLERRSNAIDLINAVNAVLQMAADDGVELRVNPATGSLVSGSGNGGFRPQNCLIGAPASSHKQGLAVDIYDPERDLAAWMLWARDRVVAAGIAAIENPRWTPTWVHMDRRQKSQYAFIPDGSAPKAPPPETWNA